MDIEPASLGTINTKLAGSKLVRQHLREMER